MAVERLRVILEMVTGQYEKKARSAATATGRIGKSASTSNKKLQEFDKSFQKFAKGAALGAAGLAAVRFAVDVGKSASDLEESVNAVEKTFGTASERITDFGRVASQAAGLSASAFNQLATSTGSLLNNFGFAADDAAKEAIKLTLRAADLASVFNTDVPSALEAVNAALRGESEPIRRYGVTLSDAAVRAKAVELGLADTTVAVDENSKAVARLELIYEQTSNAQGDFIETSQGAANSARIAAAEWENAKASAGAAFLPVAAAGLNTLTMAWLEFGADIKTAGQEGRKQVLAFSKAVKFMNDEAKKGRPAYDSLADGLKFIAEEAELTGDTFTTLATLAGLPEESFRAFGAELLRQGRELGLSEELLDELSYAIRGVDSDVIGLASRTRDLADSQEEANETTSDFELDLSNLNDTTGRLYSNTEQLIGSTDRLLRKYKALSDPVFAAIDAMQTYEDELATVLKDGKTTGEEAADIAQAWRDVELAMAELGGGDVEAGFSELSRLVSEGLNVPLAEADELARGFLESLGLLASRDWAINFTVDRFGDDPNLIPGDFGNPNKPYRPNIPDITRLPEGSRAMGGPVSANLPYLVGERGPEMFVPASAGRVAANGESGMSVTINATIQESQLSDPSAARRFVEYVSDEIDRYRREGN